MATKKTSTKAKTKKRQAKTSVAATAKSISKSKAELQKVGSRTTSISYASLRKWNLSLGVLHFVQGLIIIILSKSSALPVVTHYLAVDSLASQAAGHPVLAAAQRHLFDVNLAYLVAAFFFMSAIAHFVIGTVYRKRYETDLGTGINKARWIEYGISASTMMVAIALLSGVYEFSSLIMIFALILIMNLLGLVMEVHNQTTKKTNWLSYWLGVIAGLAPWIVIAVYLKGAVMYGSGVPGFVYWIYGSMFVLFASFAINMLLQYRKKGKWSNYLYGERVYMILSLIAKTALAWQIFAGTLRP